MTSDTEHGRDPLSFDPSRWYAEQRSFAKQIADEIVRDSGSFGYGGAAVHVGAMLAAARIWLRDTPNVSGLSHTGVDRG